MNKEIDKLLNHRTIRQFTDEKLDEDVVTTLLKVSNRTATSTGMQTYSIIRITDPVIKEKLSIIGQQDYMKDATELFIFIVDQFRNAEIAKEKGVDLTYSNDMDKFFQGFSDSLIACQNMVCAAELEGLGANYFGNILNDPQAVIDLLKLPPLTFPAIGLGIGIPNQNPQLKPRIPLKYKVFENSYHVFDDYVDLLSSYDEKMKEYYDLRNSNQRVDSFTNQVKTRALIDNKKRKAILQIVKKQGFDLNV